MRTTTASSSSCESGARVRQDERVELGQMQKRAANVFHILDGKVTQLVVYFDYERALTDLGLALEDAADPPG